MRNVSVAFKSYTLNLTDSGVVVWLLTLKCDGKIFKNITSNNEVVFSNGVTYQPSQIILRMPQTGLLRGKTGGQLQLEGASRSLVEWIRIECQVQPIVILRIVMLATPDEMEYGPIELLIGEASFSSQQTTFPLLLDEIFRKPVQSVNFDPARTPALFV